MPIETPDWVKHAVFYQIFPDRFARSSRLQHRSSLKFKPWGSPPSEQGYQGGDLLGIVDRLDYLQELGITALYLNPIFSSAANHRYHTFDYFQVDPLLGGNNALRELIDAVHDRGMHIVLDGVFNHASRGFWPFHHILENGPASPYIDWFIVEDWPLRPYPDQPEPGKPINYAAWWDLPMLPKLNTANPDVQDYIIEIAQYWLEFGIDGWRLDVPAEIDDDVFWRRFREGVKSVNPEAYICGEIWEDASRWLQGDQFDAVMNYIFCWATISFFGADSLNGYTRHHLSLEPRDAPAFKEAIDYMHGLYDWEINHVQLNLLGSHDMARPFWIMSENVPAMQLALLFQMTIPGAPCIYYGDEIGMSAGDDPDCREAFPWHAPEAWNQELLAWCKAATQLRHGHKTLRTGAFQVMEAKNRMFMFKRSEGGQEEIRVTFNAGKAAIEATVNPEGANWAVIWPPEKAGEVTSGKTLQIPPQSALILKHMA